MAYVQKSGFISPSKVFLAFNKQIAETLKQRCPSDVLCSTFHALGFRALKSSGIVEQKVRVDGQKCRKILYDFLEYDNDDFKPILRLVSLLKGGHAVSYEDIDTTSLIELHNLDFQEPERAVKLALQVLVKSDEQRDIIDFDDMLHMAVRFNAHFDARDWIFVDEAQDLNHIQHEIVERLTKPSSRIVAVGDPHQAIYGFRGALADSMSQLQTRFSMRTYPLSVSYRCPKAVVREAQKYLRS